MIVTESARSTYNHCTPQLAKEIDILVRKCIDIIKKQIKDSTKGYFPIVSEYDFPLDDNTEAYIINFAFGNYRFDIIYSFNGPSEKYDSVCCSTETQKVYVYEVYLGKIVDETNNANSAITFHEDTIFNYKTAKNLRSLKLRTIMNLILLVDHQRIDNDYKEIFDNIKDAEVEADKVINK